MNYESIAHTGETWSLRPEQLINVSFKLAYRLAVEKERYMFSLGGSERCGESMMTHSRELELCRRPKRSNIGLLLRIMYDNKVRMVFLIQNMKII